jgi:hypothetical protein
MLPQRFAGVWVWQSMVSLMAVALWQPFLVAQQRMPPDWVELIRNAEAGLTPERIPSALDDRQRLEHSLRSLEAFLATSPTQGARWRAVLGLDAAEKALASSEPELDVLTDVEKRFRQNYTGLEMEPFIKARDALARYVRSQRVASDPERTMTILRNRLKRLSDRYQKPEEASDVGEMHELGQTITYLQHSQQAPELVQAYRNTYSMSNARVLIGSDFVEKRFARPVHEQNPVNELILGTTVRGQSQLTGLVSPRLIDNPTQATLRLHLMADFCSANRGYNRSVVLNTQSSAQLQAAESIALTDSGLVSLGDTTADAELHTQITGIQHQLKIVRKIAAKQAAKKKPQADAISRSRLENRLTRQFHEQLASQLAEANQRLNSAARVELARLGIAKPHRSSWSTRDCMSLDWRVQSDTQLAAPGPCPLPISTQGMTLQIHQSLIGNLLDPVLAGRVLRSEDMDGYIAQFGEAAKRIPRKQDDGPWSITMQGFQPVEMLLDDSLIRFRIRTSRLDREDQSLDQPATIDAAYRVEIVDGRVQLHREGDVNVNFSGTAQKGVRSVTLRTFLKNKFEQLFRPELLDKPLDWSEKLPPQFQDLRLASLSIDDGWMQVQFH